jgi:hypothetical protein
MGRALVAICPDLAVGVCWRNQFIGNLWGVSAGVLIPLNQPFRPLIQRSLTA